MSVKWSPSYSWCMRDVNGSMQERRNSITSALELRLSFTNPWMYSWASLCYCTFVSVPADPLAPDGAWTLAGTIFTTMLDPFIHCPTQIGSYKALQDKDIILMVNPWIILLTPVSMSPAVVLLLMTWDDMNIMLARRRLIFFICYIYFVTLYMLAFWGLYMKFNYFGYIHWILRYISISLFCFHIFSLCFALGFL